MAMCDAPDDMEMDVDNFMGSGETIGIEEIHTDSTSHDSTELNQTHLFSLPVEIHEKILGFLDVSSLKNFRLVSKHAKYLVEQPAVLKKLPIYISCRERRNEVLLSNVSWNNFSIEIHSSDSAEDLVPLLNRTHNNNSLLKNVKFIFKARHHTKSTMSDILSNVGTQLESLHLYGKEMLQFAYDNSWIRLGCREIPPQNLFLLKHLNLEIGRLTDLDNSMGFLQCLTDFFLQNCPNLITVKLPIGFPLQLPLTAYVPPMPYDHTEDCRILLDFLERKKETGSTILFDFCSDTKCLGDSGNVPIWPYLLNDRILIQMATICESTGGLFYNVPSSALPNSTEQYFLTDKEKHCLNNSVKSVLSVNTMAVHLKNAYVPPNTTIQLSVVGLRNKNGYSNIRIPADLNISSISVHQEKNRLTRVYEQNKVYDELFCVCRPTVTEFQVFIRIPREDWWFGQLSNLYPNLRKLHVGNSRIKTINFGLPFTDLVHLEDLTLDNVSIAFDQFESALKAVTVHPFIASMKRLVHLRLLNASLDNVTDYCFQNLFSEMQPKTFILKLRKPTLITFKNGICSLASVESEFKNTVEHFECFIPRGSTRGDMNSFVKNFTHLRKFRIHDIYEAD